MSKVAVILNQLSEITKRRGELESNIDRANKLLCCMTNHPEKRGLMKIGTEVDLVCMDFTIVSASIREQIALDKQEMEAIDLKIEAIGRVI